MVPFPERFDVVPSRSHRSAIAQGAAIAAFAAAAILPFSVRDAQAQDLLWNRFGAGPTNAHGAVTGPAKAGVPSLATAWQMSGITPITSQIVTDGTNVYHGDFSGTVFARRIADGGVVWQTALPGGFEVFGPKVGNTPLVLPGAVYATEYYSATLFKLDRATGAIVWQRAIGTDPFHRTSGSPVLAVYRGRSLIIQGLDGDQNQTYLRDAAGQVVDGPDGNGLPQFTDMPTYAGQLPYSMIGRVVAVDADTGEIVWSRAVNAGPGEYGIGVWSTPAVDYGRGRIYVGTGQSYNAPSSANACAVLGIDLADGSIDQVLTFKPSPITTAESCVWGTQYPGGVGSPAVDPDLPGTAGDTDVGSSPVLHTERVSPFRTVDLVTAINKAGRIRSFDRSTGDLVWERTFSTTGGSIFGNAGVSYAGGVIFAPVINDVSTTSRGTLNIENGIDVAPLFEALIVGSTSRNSTTLVALDAATGAEIWIRPSAPGHTFGALSISRGVVYHANFAGVLAAYDATNGSPLFTTSSPVVEVAPGFSINAPFPNSVTFAAGAVLAATGFGITPTDGSITQYRPPSH